MNPVLYWNGVLLEATRRDHTLGFGASLVEGRALHGGPTRTSRAMAIASIAIHDAVCAARRPAAAYLTKRYGDVVPPAAAADEAAVIAGAAYGALSLLYPKFVSFLDDALRSEVAAPETNEPFKAGREIGAMIFARRSGDKLTDGAYQPDPTGAAPRHQVDPLNPKQGYLTAEWGALDRFSGAPRVLLAPPPYDATPQERERYRQDADEVLTKGGQTAPSRTDDETEVGVFWGYDGAFELGVPPRLYNQIARQLIASRKLGIEASAELLAALNVAMADAGIDAWHWKYEYDFWRPVVGLRHSDDPSWKPLGLPRTNDGRQSALTPTTPHFPAYPSGHATFGAAVFQVLRLYLSNEATPISLHEVLAAEGAPGPVAGEGFSFVSDELNGLSLEPGPTGAIRPLAERAFRSFAHAVFENAISRVFLGVHWRFDGVPRPGDAAEYGGVPLGLEIGKQAHALFATAPSLMGVATPAE